MNAPNAKTQRAGSRISKALWLALGVILHLENSASATTGAVRSLIDVGRQELVNQNLGAAKARFAEAVEADSNDEEANALYALARLLVLAEAPEIESLWLAAGAESVSANFFAYDVEFPEEPAGAGWFSQASVTHDGIDAAQTLPLGDNELVSLTSSVTGPGTLSFWWSVSSEFCCDFLTFTAGDVFGRSISGIRGWERVEVVLPTGVHMLTWQFSKDGSVSDGSDAAWVDEVTYTGDTGFAPGAFEEAELAEALDSIQLPWTSRFGEPEPFDLDNLPEPSRGFQSQELREVYFALAMPEIAAAAAGLARIVDPEFVLELSEEETSRAEISIGYGDIQLIRALLRWTLAFGYVTRSYNSDVLLHDLFLLNEEGELNLQNVLALYPRLLTLVSDEDLPFVEADFRAGAALYHEASSIIRNRPDADDGFFNLPGRDLDKEEDLREFIEDLVASTDNPTIIREEKVYLRPFFDGTVDLRSIQPEWWENLIIAGSLPDSTAAGVLPEIIETDIEDFFGEHGFLVSSDPGAQLELLSPFVEADVMADGDTYFGDVSQDGRFVAVESSAGNLGPVDANGLPDIYLLDRLEKRIERISQALDGGETDNFSTDPSVSDDGRYVTFASYATNLITPSPSSTSKQIYVYDRQNEVMELVSRGMEGAAGDGASDLPEISADGRWITYQSLAANLLEQAVGGNFKIFLYDVASGENRLVSKNLQGEPVSGSYLPSIDDDGERIAFSSVADDLAPGDSNFASDLFVFDRLSESIERVSVSSEGREGDGRSFRGQISGDGRFVVFESYASNLVEGDTNGDRDIFVRDLLAGETERVNLSDDGKQQKGESFSFGPHISSNGEIISYTTDSATLAPQLLASFKESAIVLRNRVARLNEEVYLFDFMSPSAPGLSGDGNTVVFSGPAEKVGFTLESSEVNDLFALDRAAIVDTVSLQSAYAVADDASTSILVPVKRTPAPDSTQDPFSVSYRIEEIISEIGSTYAVGDGVLSVEDGATEGVIEIPFAADVLRERSDLVAVRLYRPAGGVNLGDPRSVAVVLPGRVAKAYDGWKRTFLDVVKRSDPAISGFFQNPDGDSLPNLLEFAFGTNPLRDSSAYMPQTQRLIDEEAEYLSLVYRENPESEMVYTVEVADSPGGPWQHNGDSTGITYTQEVGLPVTNADGTLGRTVRETTSIDENTARYMRLRIEFDGN